MKYENITASQWCYITFFFLPVVFQSCARELFVHLLGSLGPLRSPGLTAHCIVLATQGNVVSAPQTLQKQYKIALSLYCVTYITQRLPYITVC